MRVVLITGAHGFCARHLAKRLSQQSDVRLVGIDIQLERPHAVALDDYACVDLTDAKQVQEAFEQFRPDEVFHLAGLIHGPAADVYRTNLLGSIHLFEAVRQVKPDSRVLVVGSAAEYGLPLKDEMLTEQTVCRPTGPYGQSKYAATMAALDYVSRYGLRFVVVRPFNLVGAAVPKSLIVGAVLQRMRESLTTSPPGVVPVGNLNSERDFLAVEDAVDAYVQIMQGNHWGEVFNICSGQPVSIRSIVLQLLTFADQPIQIQVDPTLIRASDPPRVIGCWEKAHRSFGFEPKVSLTAALTAAWEHAGNAMTHPMSRGHSREAA